MGECILLFLQMPQAFDRLNTACYFITILTFTRLVLVCVRSTVRLQAKKDMKAEKREKAKIASAPLRKAKGLKVRDLRVLEYKRRKAVDDERLFREAIRVPRRELNEFWMIDELYALNTSQFVWGPVEENLHFFTPKQQEQLLQHFQQQKAAALPGGVAEEEGKAVKGRKATKQPAKKQKAKKVEGALTAEDLEHEQTMERIMNSELADMYL